MTKLRNKPCKDCLDRYSGCHAKCEKYAAAKADVEELKAKHMDELNYIGYVADTVWRNRKRKGKRK